MAWLFGASMQQLEFIADEGQLYWADSLQPKSTDFKYAYSDVERTMLNAGLVDMETLDQTLVVDLKYATEDNFTGSILCQGLKRAFLQPPIAQKLMNAQRELKQIDSTLILVVFDAARPQSVQFTLWDWAIANDMEKYVASPWTGSNHSYGCAVDVTIMATDSLLDMGTAYDHFGPEAEPRFQWQLLKEGKLSQEQIENRLLLAGIMKSAGFQAIQTEWWHYNGLSKERARQHYSLVE